MANVGLLKGMKSIPKQEPHLAGGWSAILFSLQGDSDYFSNALGLPRWQVNRNCCALLMQLVPKAGINSPNAPWIATLWTPAEWRASPTSGYTYVILAQRKKCGKPTVRLRIIFSD